MPLLEVDCLETIARMDDDTKRRKTEGLDGEVVQ
jgi:hypothetical protein